MPTLTAAERSAIDFAIAAKNQPRPPRDGRGLIVTVPGARFKTLVNAAGKLTKFGTYYFEKVETPAPNRGFDYSQRAVRVGRRETIKLLDGTTVTARTWNPRTDTFKFTKVGKDYYKHHTDRWLVDLPAKVWLQRRNGSYYLKDDYIPSTATTLGEIQLTSTMTESEQEAEVQRRTQAFLENTSTAPPPVGDGPDLRTLVEGDYERSTYDDTRPILYNRQETMVAPDGQVSVQTTLDRPLHRARPWRYPDLFRPEGMTPEAFEATEDGSCVPFQLAKVLKRYGRPIWTQDEVESLLRGVASQLYPGDDLEELLGDHGCTARMVLELCKAHGIPVHIVWGQALIAAWTPDSRDHHMTGVALCVKGSHAYFYSDSKTREIIAKLPVEAPESKSSKTVSIEHRNDVPDAIEWEEMPRDLGACEAGKHYMSPCLTSVREELHKDGVCPYVFLSTPTCINALSVKGESKKDAWCVHLRRPEFDVCLKFCELFSCAIGARLAYQGESLGVLGARAFELLTLPGARPQTTSEQKSAILRRQDGKCARCSSPCEDDGELDHRLARASFGADTEDNLEFLCKGCHDLKTQEEGLGRVEDKNRLLSRFSMETYEAFVRAAKPPQICCVLHEADPSQETWNIDIARCRRNGLAENVVDLPVFASTDEIVPATFGQLADYNWVEAQCRSPLLALPYFGPGWYSKASCAYMLDHRIIKLSDMKLSFNAAAHVPARCLHDWMETLENLWAKATEGSEFTSKLAINAMAGLWSATEHRAYRLEVTNEPTDVRFDGKVIIRKTPGGEDNGDHDYIMEFEQLKLSSLRPIHQLCLEAERLNVARALYIIRKHCSPLKSQILSIQVDGIFFQPGKRAAPKIEKEIAATCYGNLHLLQPQLPQGQRTILGDRVDWQLSLCKSNSDTKVYRIGKLEPGYYEEKVRRYVGGTLSFVDAPRPLMPALEWTVHREEGEDFYDRVVRPHIIGQRRTAFVCGPPGTGKSYVLKRVAEELRAQDEKVKIISLTHVAARNVNGQTAHSFVHRFVQYGRYKGWLLIDEVSMMNLPLLVALETLSLSACKIVCFGDFDQLGPICNSWRGSPMPARIFKDSRLMKTWCDCTIFEMTRCRRSDVPHFEWYTQVPRMDLGLAIQDARARFPPSAQDADWNLTISHWRRMKLNHELQAKATAAYRASGGGDIARVEIQEEGEDRKKKASKNRAQSYDLWPGTRLIGSDNEHKSVVNGALLDVIALDGEEVQVRDIETDEEFKMTIAAIAKHTRLRWAVTYPAVQGRTLKGTVRLWDAESRHFTLEALYIGVSRAQDGSLVSIA